MASVVRKAKFSEYRSPKTLSGDKISASGSKEEGYRRSLTPASVTAWGGDKKPVSLEPSVVQVWKVTATVTWEHSGRSPWRGGRCHRNERLSCLAGVLSKQEHAYLLRTQENRSGESVPCQNTSAELPVGCGHETAVRRGM